MQMIKQFVGNAIQAWHGFWCPPTDPIGVSVLRVLAGGMFFYTLLVWGVDLEAFFLKDGGWQSEALVQEIQAGSWAQSLWWLVPDSHIWTFHLCCLVVVFAFWIGLATPITKWLTLVIIVSYANRVPLANYGLDQINSVLSLYLCLAPCGAWLSIDNLLRRKFATRAQDYGMSQSAGLAMRMIQVHFCIIYLWAGLAKLQGVSWWTGEAVWRAAANFEYQQVSLTWLVHFPWFYQLASVSTWAWELSFPFLIWNRRLRLPMLLVGLTMHLGIGMFMGMWTFGLIMCFGYVAFIPTKYLHKVLGTLFRNNASAPNAGEAVKQAIGVRQNLSEQPLAGQRSGGSKCTTVIFVGPHLGNRQKVSESLKRIGYSCVGVNTWDEAISVFDALGAKFVMCNAVRTDGRRLSSWVEALASKASSIEEGSGAPLCLALVPSTKNVPPPTPDSQLWYVPTPICDEDLSAILDGHLPAHLYEQFVVDADGRTENRETTQSKDEEAPSLPSGAHK